MTNQEKLHYLRLKYKLTVKEMAEQSGIGYSALRHISTGFRTNLNEENTAKLNKYLDQFEFPENF